MRLTLRILGLELIDLDVSTDEAEAEPATPPRTFGFHASGSGILELSDDRMLDTMDS